MSCANFLGEDRPIGTDPSDVLSAADPASLFHGLPALLMMTAALRTTSVPREDILSVIQLNCSPMELCDMFYSLPHAVRNRARETRRKEASEKRKHAADKREAARKGKDGGEHSNSDEDGAGPSHKKARLSMNRVGQTGGSSAQDK